MIRSEWKSLFQKNKIMPLVLIGIIIIPTIYTTLFLASMWDPYGKLSNLPVAVVNLDKEVIFNDQVLHIGKDLVESLKDNDSLQFHFVDIEEGYKGLNNGTYYMVVTIPEDFSLNAATVMDEKPQKMELYYATSPARNYIASKMSENAVERIKENLKEEVSKVYINALFDVIAEASDGMGEASKGAGKLKSGMLEISDGLLNYTEGVSKVASGISQLAENNSPLNQGISKLASGMIELKEGTYQLANGLKAMSDSIGLTLPGDSDIEALGNGLEAFHSAIEQLNAAVSSLSLTNQSESISQSLTAIGSSVQGGAADVQAISNAAAVLSQANLTKEQILALQTILNSTKELGGYLKTIGTETNNLRSSFSELSADLGQLGELKTALNALAQNSDAVLNGSKEAINGLYSGLNKVKATLDEQLIPGGQNLDQGMSQVENAIEQKNGLKDGISSYTTAVETLNEGVAALNHKSKDLTDGVTKLSDGAAELATALGQGAEKMEEAKAGDDTIDMIASPIEAEKTQVTYMPDNGHAMSAYIMSVALWVGCIAFCLMYPLTEYAGELKSGCSWFLSKASVAYTIAIVQAIVMILMLKFVNGLNPADFSKTIFLGCLASLAFMSLIYFFNACFGKIGSFIMLIFMVIQLSGSAGTYPVELSGDIVAKIHDYLPFSYSIDAFRCALSGSGSMTEPVIVLSAIFTVFAILSVLIFNIRTKRIRKGKPYLFELLEKGGLA